MSIKDKMKNAKESHLFDELSEKEKFEVILEGKLKVRLISELKKIKAEIEEMKGDGLPYNASDYLYGRYQALDIVDNILQDRIAELKGE